MTGITATKVPEFILALYSLAKDNLVAPNVHYGYGVSDDPGNSLNIGIDAPMSAGPASTAESSQTWANANYGARDETGSVVSAAYSWNGEGDQQKAVESAYATVNALASLVHADPSLGDLVMWSGVTATDLTTDQNSDGAEALVVFRISFRARLF